MNLFLNPLSGVPSGSPDRDSNEALEQSKVSV